MHRFQNKQGVGTDCAECMLTYFKESSRLYFDIYFKVKKIVLAVDNTVNTIIPIFRIIRQNLMTQKTT